MTGWVRTRRPRGEDGQMAVAFIIFTAMLVLAFFVVALVPVGASTNERSRAQIAADAAALAGAEQARQTFAKISTKPGLLLAFNPLGPATLAEPITGETGEGQAKTYAQQNKATVKEYHLFPVTGQTYAKVEHNDAAYPEHGRAVAEATAEMDVSFTCVWLGVPPGLYYPAGAPTFTAELICGAWRATYVVTNTVGYPTESYDTSETEIFDDLEPRLVK